MGRLRPKIAASTVTLAIASASLLALAQPAAATDTMICESYNSMIGYCDLYPAAGAHNERWTVDGNPQPTWDNSSSLAAVHCQAGVWVNVSVSYLNDYGAGMQTSRSVKCSNGAPM
ncbi:MAG TPA: hypothetical protein VFD94_10325 [Jatrophihabitans sp.]|jgi:hypothetical protein|nr:hypothetical protein [Jatrophihabitans sp.]